VSFCEFYAFTVKDTIKGSSNGETITHRNTDVEKWIDIVHSMLRLSRVIPDIALLENIDIGKNKKD